MKFHFDNMAYHSHLSLNVAFPVVKVYVVVGNEVEDPFVNGAAKMNHYFEIKGVQDIRVNCNNDDVPVDTLLMNIANPSFIRTDNASVAGVNVTRDFSHTGTAAEVYLFLRGLDYSQELGYTFVWDIQTILIN